MNKEKSYGEYIRSIDPIGFRIESGPNASQNPEIGANVTHVDDTTVPSQQERAEKIAKLSALSAIIGLSLIDLHNTQTAHHDVEDDLIAVNPADNKNS